MEVRELYEKEIEGTTVRGLKGDEETDGEESKEGSRDG